MFPLRLLTVSTAASIALWSTVASAQAPQALASPPPLPPGPNAPVAPVSPPPPAPAGPSDLELRAIGQSPVSLQMADGAQLSGQIMASDPTLLVFRLSSTGQVISLPRAQIVLLTVQQPYAAALPQPEQTLTPLFPPKQRHFGISLSIVPGVVFDLDVGLFRAFANLGIVLPLATSGELLPVSFGAGVGIPLSKSRPSLKLDVMGYVAMMIDAKDRSYTYAGSTYSLSSEVTNLSAGLGIGLHHTWQNGLTLGGTVPILGYAAYLSSSSSSSRNPSIGERTALYFLASATALPLFYLGYRF